MPPLYGPFAGHQAPFTHPLADLGNGFARRPGFYGKLAWMLSVPVRFELFHYDNRADPEVVTAAHEWGWRTRFDDAAIVADLGGSAELKAQALDGRTRMGFIMNGRRFADERFRSAYVMLTKPLGNIGIAARAEAFGTHNRGSIIGSDYDENGWSAMLAAKRDWANVTGLVELLHVSSSRDDREAFGLDPRQRQTQLQAELRMHW